MIASNVQFFVRAVCLKSPQLIFLLERLRYSSMKSSLIRCLRHQSPVNYVRHLFLSCLLPGWACFFHKNNIFFSYSISRIVFLSSTMRDALETDRMIAGLVASPVICLNGGPSLSHSIAASTLSSCSVMASSLIPGFERS